MTKPRKTKEELSQTEGGKRQMMEAFWKRPETRELLGGESAHRQAMAEMSVAKNRAWRRQRIEGLMQEEEMESGAAVTVYTVPACGQCDRVRARLEKLGVRYRLEELSPIAKGLRLDAEVLGQLAQQNMAAPVIRLGESEFVTPYAVTSGEWRPEETA